MSFRNNSQVHDHLSTKHPLFSHRAVEDGMHEDIIDLTDDEERFAERAPPEKVEKPLRRF